MPCFHPLTAFRLADGGISFRETKHTNEQLQLACGQCIGCKEKRSRDWTIRCSHEQQLHEANSFITLTFREENLPESRSLEHSYFQLFMKRTRRRLSPARVSYYMAGEYGEQLGRPHFHAILFGHDFKDKLLYSKNKAGDRLYTSATLDQLWTHGGATTGDVTNKSIAYVARYCFQKITGQIAQQHYEWVDTDGVIHQRKPEYSKMSLNPAIGKRWLEKYKSDIYPEGLVVHNGSKTRPPRYYDQRHKKEHPQTHELIEYQRFLIATAQQADNTEARLKVREQVAHARLNQLKRDTIK